MKIKLRDDLYEQALANEQVCSKLDVSVKASLSYPTVLELASGEHGTTTYAMLAAFLQALGFTPELLAKTKFTDIFKVD
jgi:hypothetical protein